LSSITLQRIVKENATPWLLYPQELDQIPTHSTGGLFGLKTSMGRHRKISPAPVFNPQTAQTGASHYTDYTISAHNNNNNNKKI